MKNRTNFRKISSFCLCLKAKTANPDTNAHVLSARPDDAVVVISNLFSLMNFNKNEEVVNLKSFLYSLQKIVSKFDANLAYII